MHLRTHATPRDFLDYSAPLLLRNEAENNLMLGIVSRLAVRPEPLPSSIYLTTIDDNGSAVAAAAMTPPFRLIITRAPEEGLRLILEDLHKRGIALPGILAPKKEAEILATIWQEMTGNKGHLGMHERIYQIEKVIPPSDIPGTMRAATADEIEMIIEWGMGFGRDTGSTTPQERMEQMVRSYIEEGRLFIWEDKRPVSMAGWIGPTPNGVRINFVYTPPEQRGRGYASACVAALSQHLLQNGRRFCFLFTDLANPTSNSIYQKIGYQPVCDFSQYDFDLQE